MGVALAVLPGLLAVSLIVALLAWAARAAGPAIPPRVVTMAVRALEVWLLVSGAVMLLLGVVSAANRPARWAGWGSIAFAVVLLGCGLVTDRGTQDPRTTMNRTTMNRPRRS